MFRGGGTVGKVSFSLITDARANLYSKSALFLTTQYIQLLINRIRSLTRRQTDDWMNERTDRQEDMHVNRQTDR